MRATSRPVRRCRPHLHSSDRATFFAANALKLIPGGYVPVLIGLTIIVTMLTWLRGRSLLAEKLRRDSVELEGLLATLERRPPTRVAGAAVFLQTDPVYAPSALMHNLKHNRVLHDILVFISVETMDVPRVSRDERVEVKKLPLGAFLVEARFGYMEQPDVPAPCASASPTGSPSIRARRPISSAAAPFAPHPRRACRSGNNGSSSCWPTSRRALSNSSASRLSASSNSACRCRSDA